MRNKTFERKVDDALIQAVGALYSVVPELEAKGGALYLSCNERAALGAWLLLSTADIDREIPKHDQP